MLYCTRTLSKIKQGVPRTNANIIVPISPFPSAADHQEPLMDVGGTRRWPDSHLKCSSYCLKLTLSTGVTRLRDSGFARNRLDHAKGVARRRRARFMDIVVVTCHLTLASKSVVTTESTPWYWARELLWFIAVSDFVVTDQIGPAFAGKYAMILHAEEQWFTRAMEVVAFVGDIVAMAVCGEKAALESAQQTLLPILWNADGKTCHAGAFFVVRSAREWRRTHQSYVGRRRQR